MLLLLLQTYIWQVTDLKSNTYQPVNQLLVDDWLPGTGIKCCYCSYRYRHMLRNEITDMYQPVKQLPVDNW